ncbi:MAG TPA: ABC transporter permease [Flavisolibacter sp.]|jgi:ABC-2 type transport system permease protein|nr:ABC transporter permease [Flavisolibacter sp.]
MSVITLPSASTALRSLLRSDFTTQWRNRRSVIMVLLVPVIILISWKGLVNKLGAAFVLSTCITIGLNAIGLMGYSNALARDRDRGIFQRLRVAPIPTAFIMVSRLAVQMAMILILTTLVFIISDQQLHIRLSAQGYILGYVAAIAGGALYLGLGQMIAGLQKNAEAVNATTRLVYFVFIMVGMFGEMGMLGDEIKKVVHWSPYGTVRTIVAGAMKPEGWSTDASLALALTIGYALVFSFLGIKWFRWNTK